MIFLARMPAILAYPAIIFTLLASLSLLLWTAFTGVPPQSSSKSEADAVIALLKQAKLPDHAVIIDLGSGWGSLVIALARAFPQASVQGVEMSPFPYLISRFRTRTLSNVSLKRGNFFHSNLKNANAITCYLMPARMAQVSELLDRTVKPGTCVVANAFQFRGRCVAASTQGAWCGTVALYIWPARQWTG